MLLKSFGHTSAVLADVKPGDFTWAKNRIISKLTNKRYPPDTFSPYLTYRGYSVVDGISEVIANFKPDVAIVQAGKPIPMVLKFLELGIKTVFYIRDVEFNNLGGGVPIDTNLVVVANSKFTATRFRKSFGINATVIPPLVRREAYVTNTTRQYAVFINPVPKKGVEIAIALALKNPDIPFLFLEGWPLTPGDMLVLREKLSSVPNILFQRATANMRQIYGMARLVLMPSQWDEAWGRVASEAHFSGIPVLASHIGGLPESVGPGGRLVAPYDSIEAWDRQLRHVWHNDKLYCELSNAALDYSHRVEISPKFLIDKLILVIHGYEKNISPFSGPQGPE